MNYISTGDELLIGKRENKICNMYNSVMNGN